MARYNTRSSSHIPKRIFSKGLKSQGGQALVEHIILWPALVIVVLGTLQAVFLYRDKATFNDVVLRAAREGALHNARVGPMQQMMVKGLVPLYLKRNPNAANYLLAEGRAYLDNQINPRNGNRIGNAPIRMQVISPNADVFRRFARDMFQLQDGCEENIRRRRGNDITRCREQRFRQIPNDNLNIRSAGTTNVRVEGRTVRMNLQDANILKVRGHWCAPLTVPFMRAAFYNTLFRFNMLWSQDFWFFYASKREVRDHPHWGACAAKTVRNAGLAAAGVESRKYYIPISSDAVVRMQSPVRQ
ncbi:TadE/TadG family type IV pilus assembly protein [Agarilytica rhodophyticola]|uniref:TadE/TadG family type IV pilus assembly protein n=1 Tax=Agarilytica rhodophyticola TaxID=1737490 RepID=UPI001319FED6|nr:TadE family protein [Agarilytica rhodophyticola]